MRATDITIGTTYLMNEHPNRRSAYGNAKVTVVEACDTGDRSLGRRSRYTTNAVYENFIARVIPNDGPFASLARRGPVVYLVTIHGENGDRRAVVDASQIVSTWTDHEANVARQAAYDDEYRQRRATAWADREALVAQLRPIVGDAIAERLLSTHGTPYSATATAEDRQRYSPTSTVVLTVAQLTELVCR